MEDSEIMLNMTAAEFMHAIILFAIDNREQFQVYLNQSEDEEFPMDLIMHRLGMVHSVTDLKMAQESMPSRLSPADALRAALRLPTGNDDDLPTDGTGQYL